ETSCWEVGGILLGVNLAVFDIGSISEGDFYVKFQLRNKEDGFKWVLMAVYGAAQPDLKEQFLTELAHTCSNESQPLLVGGDFNIIRSQEEKNNNSFDPRWPFLFNEVINSLNLREIDLSGRQFTWANNLENPTYEKLDRVLMNTEWEQKFPLVTCQALPHAISDHSPIILRSGSHAHFGNLSSALN
ncbi:Os04g0204200, partial [Oryza sativa Japonica Group]